MNESVRDLFLAIYQGNRAGVTGLVRAMSPADINYQLKEGDVTELKDAMGLDDSRWDAQFGFEEGMTPLLLALSKERVTIAEDLLARDDIDASLTNAIGVNAIHMLVMISHGDARYDERGIYTGVVAGGLALSQRLSCIARALIDKGCSVANQVVERGQVNLLAEAIFHQQLATATVLVQQAAPLPTTNDQLGRMRDYYHINLHHEDDAVGISRTRLREVYDCIAPRFMVGRAPAAPTFFTEAGNTFDITNASALLAILGHLVIDRGSNGLKERVACDDVVQLIRDHIAMARTCGGVIDFNVFRGTLEGFGENLPEEIKRELREPPAAEADYRP